MEIKLDCTINKVLRFLLEEFNINLNLKKDSISKIKSLHIIKQPHDIDKRLSGKIYFILDENTIIDDLVKFFKRYGSFSIELRNKDGVKLPKNLTINQASSFHSAASTKRSIEDDLQVVINLDKSGDFSDADWMARVLEKTVYKANKSSEKWLIINVLISLIQNNNHLSFKQNYDVIISCFNENSDYIKIYNMLIETKNINAVNFGKRLNDELNFKK